MNRDSAFGELVHEFIGTAVLILLGDGVVADVLFGTRLGTGYLDFSSSGCTKKFYFTAIGLTKYFFKIT